MTFFHVQLQIVGFAYRADSESAGGESELMREKWRKVTKCIYSSTVLKYNSVVLKLYLSISI